MLLAQIIKQPKGGDLDSVLSYWKCMMSFQNAQFVSLSPAFWALASRSLHTGRFDADSLRALCH